MNSGGQHQGNAGQFRHWWGADAHPHWQEKYTELTERMKAMKAVTAIARMMLVSVWHILSKGEVDRHAILEKVHSYFMEHCYDLGKANRPPGVTCLEMVENKLNGLRN